MAWIALFFAGLLEVVWAYFMKQSLGFTKATPAAITVLTMLASFGLLALSMKTLPLGVAYPMWTGIGAVGAFIAGAVLFGEQVNSGRIASVLLIVSGLILMKVSGR